MNYQAFRDEVLGDHCRECINQIYGITLEREDCRYMHYPEECDHCGKIKNIVVDVAPLRRWKIWLAKGPEKEGETTSES